MLVNVSKQKNILKNTVKKLRKIESGNFDEFSDKELENTINELPHIPAYANAVKFELQNRQIKETIKWQKLVAIGTGVLAITTFLLALVTYFN